MSCWAYARYANIVHGYIRYLLLYLRYCIVNKPCVIVRASIKINVIYLLFFFSVRRTRVGYGGVISIFDNLGKLIKFDDRCVR